MSVGREYVSAMREYDLRERLGIRSLLAMSENNKGRAPAVPPLLVPPLSVPGFAGSLDNLSAHSEDCERISYHAFPRASRGSPQGVLESSESVSPNGSVKMSPHEPRGDLDRSRE